MSNNNHQENLQGSNNNEVDFTDIKMKEVYEKMKNIGKNTFSIFNPKNFNNEEQMKMEITKLLSSEYLQERNIGLKAQGLENDDYSYLNALIQCLGGIPDILLYLQNNINYINNPQKIPLTFSFFQIIERLYHSSNNAKIYNSKRFIEIIEHCFPFLKTDKNPIDLYHLLFHDMHDEINEKKNQKNNQINFDKKNIYSVINYEMNLFNNNNKSIFSDLFTLFYKKEIQCTSCNGIFYELQNFISLDLDVINIYKKYQKMNLTIKDCLNEFNNPINTKRVCYICNTVSQLMVRRTIFSASNILVFILNRFNKEEEEEMKRIKFEYEDFLDMTNYIENNSQQINMKYILIGVVSFSFKEKKFVAFCKNLLSYKWTCFADENVFECNFEQIINGSTPYLLFYKKFE
jgi:ubiquitin C-terminal hydrolase